MRKPVLFLLVLSAFQSPGRLAAQPETQRAMRRCMEAGLSEPQCLSEGIGKSFKDTFLGGADLPFLSLPKVSGLRMGGAFPKSTSTGVELNFYAEQVVVGCQDLAAQAYQYSIAVRNARAIITIPLTPQPLVLTLQPDGRLAGTGALDIAGKVQVGTQTGTRTWSDGRTEPISRPVYEPRTRRCEATLLTSRGPSPDPVTLNTAGTMIVGLFMGPGGNKPPKPSPPGLRFAGEYGTQAGFDLEFRSEGVIVGCGEVAILRQYHVTPTPNGVQLTVQHGAAPFTLTFGADGKLSGNGSVQVDGRQITNVLDSKVTYAPRSATCSVGVLGLGSGGGEVIGAPTSRAPVGSSGSAVLALTATVQTAGGPVVPVGEEFFALLNEDLTKLLTDPGFSAAPGKSLLGTFARCSGPDPNCLKGMQAVAAHLVGRARSDEDGKTGFSGVAPGIYYVMAIAADYGPQPFIWNVRVELKSGQNTIVLSPKNVAP